MWVLSQSTDQLISLGRLLQSIRRTVYTPAASVQHMRIDHRGADITVAKEFLNRADVVPVFEKMGRKRMSERMRCSGLGDSRLMNGLLHNPLQNSFMHVMSTLFPGNSIGEVTTSWKDPLPSPFLAGIRILAFECVRQSDSSQAASQVALVLLLCDFKMLGERFVYRRTEASCDDLYFPCQRARRI